MDNNERSKSIEILRIIAMLMVVIHHVLLHGGLLKAFDVLSFQGVIVSILDGICQICVNVFFLISGYFLSAKKCTSYRNIKLYFRVLYFSIVCMALGVILWGHVQLSSVLYTIMPITSNQWWFITKYSVLIFIAPILNHAWDKLDYQNKVRFFVAYLLCFCIVPTFIPWSRDIFGRGYEFTWVFFIFYVGRFIADFSITKKIKARKYFIVFIIMAFITGFSRPAIALAEKMTIGKYYGTDMLFTYNNIIVFISSISLFLAFLNINIKSKCIYKVGQYCIGAYLISDMAIWREQFWRYFSLNNMNIAWILGLVLGIMSVGILLDWIRSKLFMILRIESLEKRISDFLDEKFLCVIQFCKKEDD